MAKSKLVQANEKIAEAAVNGYKKIEGGVVGGYHRIEDGVVSSFTKITDKFVDHFLTHDGESVEEAKKRPVSYTHLDVYKRQVAVRAHILHQADVEAGPSGQDRLGVLGNFAAQETGRVLVGRINGSHRAHAVSYTHLIWHFHRRAAGRPPDGGRAPEKPRGRSGGGGHPGCR